MGKNVFEVRNNLINDFKSFSQSFVKPEAEDIRSYLENEEVKDKYWPEPLLQINPHYQQGESVTELINQGILHPETAGIFVDRKGNPLTFYNHQAVAINKAREKKNYVLTTGTGSGKSLSFFVPIVDRILREKETDPTPRIRAIIMYPMNALANSQLEEINKKFLERDPECGITVRRYTGQEDTAARNQLIDNPPDILLTNYMMMELILTRYQDVDISVIEHAQGLEFLVLDELHTYRGRQGSDVALLIRRLRNRLHADSMICIGTSATMSSMGTREEQQKNIADVATTLFGSRFSPENVIIEVLSLVTKNVQGEELKRLVKERVEGSKPCPTSLDELKKDPLAIWVEQNLSLTFNNGTYERAKPKKLSRVYEMLADYCSCDLDTARTKLNELLIAASEKNGNDETLFAFKLHQFISGPSYLLTTLEEEGKRVIKVDDQVNIRKDESDEKIPLFRTYFCRDCGKEYIPVYYNSRTGVTPRAFDETPKKEKKDVMDWGYLIPKKGVDKFVPDDLSCYPNSWKEIRNGEEVIKSDKILKKPEPMSFNLLGKEDASGVEYYYIPGKVEFCPNCLTEFDTYSSERSKLAGLSGEGRSSATTIITLNLLNQMFEDGGKSPRKLLGFVDNRQDAALQSGNFNDFISVATTRAATFAALPGSGDALSLDDLTKAVFDVLGFSDPLDKEAQTELYVEPDMAEMLKKKLEINARRVLAYRLVNDLRSAWLYTNPTLTQLGLMKYSFEGFEEMMADSAKIAQTRYLKDIRSGERSQLMKDLLKTMVGSYCLSSSWLDMDELDSLKNKVYSRIRERWSVALDEKLSSGNRLSFGKSTSTTGEGAFAFLSCSSNSRIGRKIRNARFMSDSRFSSYQGKKKHEVVEGIVQDLLDLAVYYGIVTRTVNRKDDKPYYQVDTDALRFSRGDGPERNRHRNDYFESLYKTIASQLDVRARNIFKYESREHTAQVDSKTREGLEDRFRDGKLPVLYCSPTMELGIDISSLNTVYMRNIPPTPANYAQRSGRAGRAGQAALVVTYCSAQSPHDQWYYAHSSEMVSGTVVTPSLDLANEQLVFSHMMAVWFAEAKCRIKSSVSEVLETEDENNSGFAVKADIRECLTKPELKENALREIRKLSESLGDYLTREKAPWYVPGYEENLVNRAYEKFDRSFELWRELARNTTKQMNDAHRNLQRARSPKERVQYQRMHNEASKQLMLLKQSSSPNSASSDFYIYRYLASQELLPGYNFPRLPVLAWVPAAKSQQKEDDGVEYTAISRSRFLALSEFGPKSIIYHQGNAFEVYKIKISAATSKTDNGVVGLATKTAYICPNCGFGIVNQTGLGDVNDCCPGCGSTLRRTSTVENLYRIETVETRQKGRITSMDEERKRKGYDLQTFYSTKQTLDKGKLVVSENGEELAVLRYIPSATICKVNKGWANRQDKNVNGFYVNPQTGQWVKTPNDGDDDDEEKEEEIITVHPQRIVPYVEDVKNVLILSPVLSERATDKTMSTLQAAFLRGIERVFQVESSEIAVEPLPDVSNKKALLFYEATEGGAGVLTRIANEQSSLRNVCMNALEVMHYDFDKNKTVLTPLDLRDNNSECVDGCYHCLLSYYNQTEHKNIDRHDECALSILTAIASARIEERESVTTDNQSSFKTFLYENGINIEDLLCDKETKKGIIPFYSRSNKLALFTAVPESELKVYLEGRGTDIMIIGQTRDEWNSALGKIRTLVEGRV